MRGPPVFIAQHATATCCRGCISKWHGIEKDRALNAEEIDFIVALSLKCFKREIIGLTNKLLSYAAVNVWLIQDGITTRFHTLSDPGFTGPARAFPCSKILVLKGKANFLILLSNHACLSPRLLKF
jgi:hypothetical protein